MNNKRGLSTLPIFLFIFACFFFLIFWGLALYGFSTVNTILSQNVSIGQTNLADVTSKTFGKISTAMLDSADNIAIILIFGMVLLMIMNGYFFGNSNRLWIVLDILILFFAYILSVYISNTYEIYINALASTTSIYSNELAKSSTFLLRLPTFISTIGILIMIITYSGINRDDPRGGININEF